MNGYHNISPRNMGSYIEDEHERDHVTGSGGSARAVIADLKLKLAMKEAEIQKLQATAVARAAAQQKHIAGESLKNRYERDLCTRRTAFEFCFGLYESEASIVCLGFCLSRGKH